MSKIFIERNTSKIIQIFQGSEYLGVKSPLITEIQQDVQNAMTYKAGRVSFCYWKKNFQDFKN